MQKLCLNNHIRVALVLIALEAKMDCFAVVSVTITLYDI